MPTDQGMTSRQRVARYCVKAGMAGCAMTCGSKPRAGGPVLPPLEGQVRYDEPLAKHTTFRIGGPALVHFTPGTPEAVGAAMAWAKKEGLPSLVLGLGSNVLIRDAGFKGLVIKLGKGLDAVTPKGSTWKVGAGLPTPLLARRMVG